MKPSLNAINQALKRLTGKKDVRGLLKIPRTMTTSNRYVAETYNITPWENRKPEEQKAATVAAQKILDEGNK